MSELSSKKLERINTNIKFLELCKKCDINNIWDIKVEKCVPRNGTLNEETEYLVKFCNKNNKFAITAQDNYVLKIIFGLELPVRSNNRNMTIGDLIPDKYKNTNSVVIFLLIISIVIYTIANNQKLKEKILEIIKKRPTTAFGYFEWLLENKEYLLFGATASVSGIFTFLFHTFWSGPKVKNEINNLVFDGTRDTKVSTKIVREPILLKYIKIENLKIEKFLKGKSAFVGKEINLKSLNINSYEFKIDADSIYFNHSNFTQTFSATIKYKNNTNITIELKEKVNVSDVSTEKSKLKKKVDNLKKSLEKEHGETKNDIIKIKNTNKLSSLTHEIQRYQNELIRLYETPRSKPKPVSSIKRINIKLKDLEKEQKSIGKKPMIVQYSEADIDKKIDAIEYNLKKIKTIYERINGIDISNFLSEVAIIDDIIKNVDTQIKRDVIGRLNINPAITLNQVTNNIGILHKFQETKAKETSSRGAHLRELGSMLNDNLISPKSSKNFISGIEQEKRIKEQEKIDKDIEDAFIFENQVKIQENIENDQVMDKLLNKLTKTNPDNFMGL